MKRVTQQQNETQLINKDSNVYVEALALMKKVKKKLIDVLLLGTLAKLLKPENNSQAPLRDGPHSIC